MSEQEVKNALGRIDSILATGQFIKPVLSRQDHLQIVSDLKMIQDCIITRFSLEAELKQFKNSKKKRPSVNDKDK